MHSEELDVVLSDSSDGDEGVHEQIHEISSKGVVGLKERLESAFVDYHLQFSNLSLFLVSLASFSGLLGHLREVNGSALSKPGEHLCCENSGSSVDIVHVSALESGSISYDLT